MKLKKCIYCTHLADPLHVYAIGKYPHYEMPRRTWWQTWHKDNRQCGNGPHYYFSQIKFIPELIKYLRSGRKQLREQIEHMNYIFDRENI